MIRIYFTHTKCKCRTKIKWFKANKLLLNIKKTKYSLFHKIENLNIEKNPSIKFLGVMIDEHISWRDHVRIVESKIAKKIALLHRARQALTEASLKTINLKN